MCRENNCTASPAHLILAWFLLTGLYLAVHNPALFRLGMFVVNDEIIERGMIEQEVGSRFTPTPQSNDLVGSQPSSPVASTSQTIFPDPPVPSLEPSTSGFVITSQTTASSSVSAASEETVNTGFPSGIFRIRLELNRSDAPLIFLGRVVAPAPLDQELESDQSGNGFMSYTGTLHHLHDFFTSRFNIFSNPVNGIIRLCVLIHSSDVERLTGHSDATISRIRQVLGSSGHLFVEPSALPGSSEHRVHISGPPKQVIDSVFKYLLSNCPEEDLYYPPGGLSIGKFL